MRHSLPSLNALRAVEAVSRHGTISGAAREMHVTPGAVSRQVTLLEAHFGCALFTRTQKGLQPSEKGAKLFRNVSEAFDLIHNVSEDLVGRRDRPRLSVRALGAFSTEWLLPRLSKFEEQNPDIDVTLWAKPASVDFETDDADVGIVLQLKNWPTLKSERLFTPTFLPVAAPSLLNSSGPLLAPSDLKNFRLLHSLGIKMGWKDWLRAVGLPELEPQGHWLETSSQVYQAARQGLGVALGQLLLLNDDIASGRLIAPFDALISLPDPLTYHLVWPKGRKIKPEIEVFRNWLVDELAQTEQSVRSALPNLKIVSAA